MLVSTFLFALLGQAAHAHRGLQQVSTLPSPSAPLPESSCDTAAYAGCKATFVGKQYDVAGEVTAIDDCSFRVSGYTYNGGGPDPVWYLGAAPAGGAGGVFNYPSNGGVPVLPPCDSVDDAEPCGRPPEADGADIVVVMGTDANGEQIKFSESMNHISVWCERFSVDFGNAALSCGDEPTPPAGEPTSSSALLPGIGQLVALAAGAVAALMLN